jgi:putative hydrolase of HD superfamily
MLDRLFSYVRFLNAFRDVERVVRVPGQERWENDVEHSYQLALVAWYIAETGEQELDVNKVLRYALVHDLVEVYAGDVFFGGSAISQDEKKNREQRAQQQLQERMPEFQQLHNDIAAYEAREDPESRFVYALDKVMPMLQIYLDDGRTWREKGLTLAKIRNYKDEKVTASDSIERLYGELIERLGEQPELFPAEEMTAGHGQSGRFRETLVHFQCRHCSGWWSIGDAPEDRAMYCPWCGKHEQQHV